MIKRDDLKYCYYGETVEDVLFDLDSDPGETTNVIDDPAYADRIDTPGSGSPNSGTGQPRRQSIETLATTSALDAFESASRAATTARDPDGAERLTPTVEAL